ncbi:MAG: molybdopterin-guanine dinucleotide biosynthesis protein B [Chloroflexi bacterium]|nr:molybdopterin-guanine dinucleotide biosynthesis protein B [Chloroflexota bacterium]
MVPIVCIVGKSDVGKTTLMEKLVAELKERGYRLATIKHDVHGFELDQPGKDSWRHAQAGSDVVVISSPQKLALIKKVDHDASLAELLGIIGDDMDIVLAEGFKQSTAPKIEVHRREMGEGLLCEPRELLAIASDEPLDVAVAQYSLEDSAGLASLIEAEFLTSRRSEDFSLYLDNRPVALKPFVRDIFSRTLWAMVSTLKGVRNTKSLHITAKKG